MKRTKMISGVTLMVCAFLVAMAGINTDSPDANPKWNPLNVGNLTFPLLRSGSTSVYGNLNRIILFAGSSLDEPSGNPRLNDVWIFGTFSNLADGSVFTSNGNNFQASYTGGSGNDLTLTVQ
jgi:hypothetical protein